MSATLTRYVLVDCDNIEGDWEYESYAEARTDAGATCAVIAREYEYSDSELVWTPDGGDCWPPQDPTRLR